QKRIALIGCGIWGRKILRDLLTLEVEVHVFDTNTHLAHEILSAGAASFQPGLPTTKGNYTAFVVATPSATHRVVMERILPLGLPIFLEKPLTTSYEDALALEKIVHDQVFLMHVWLYHPGIRLLSDIANNQELGEVLGIRSTRANWTSPRRDTDSIWNLAPHDITITRAILGYLPEPIAASIEEHDGIARGLVAILGRKPYSIFEVSNRYERKIREVRLHCTNGVAVLKDEKVNYIEITHGNADSRPDEIRVERRQFASSPPLLLELRSFLEYLDGGPAPISSFADGMRVIQTIHALTKLATG
ncbi:MAG: Gfo/Idh/MocA family oxidoreductase, partial [Bacteroidota bacterium]